MSLARLGNRGGLSTARKTERREFAVDDVLDVSRKPRGKALVDVEDPPSANCLRSSPLRCADGVCDLFMHVFRIELQTSVGFVYLNRDGDIGIDLAFLSSHERRAHLRARDNSRHRPTHLYRSALQLQRLPARLDHVAWR
jgi:hypothetical protein